jgi:hypothetical protein
MKLTAEQLQDNWNRLRKIINDEFPSRSKDINIIYDEFEERIMMMPASSMEHFHNAFPGGYVDHILRVYDCALTVYNSWQSMGSDMTGYTLEELKFAAIHHDLGKIGWPGKNGEVYIPNDSEWHRKNQGRIYKVNPENAFAMVPDLGLWMLQQYNIKVSWNEYQTIRIHDGLYDEANKPYFISRFPESKLRVNMPVVLHHADHMASVIEYERWKTGNNNSPKKAVVKKVIGKMVTTSSSDASDIFKGLFE